MWKKTSFGEIWKFTFKHELMGGFEIMHFCNEGKPHAHAAEEIALCTGGHGAVLIETDTPFKFMAHEVREGQYVRVPANSRHYMVPAKGTILKMVILYAA